MDDDVNRLAQLLMNGPAPTAPPQPDWRQLYMPLMGQRPMPFNPPPAPVGSWNLPTPNFHGSVESQRAGEGLRYSGGMSVPAMGGELGLLGSYFKPDQYAPADWSAMMNFKKRF